MSKDEANRQPDSGLAADWNSEQFLTLIERMENTASATRTHRLLSGRCTLTARKMDWEAVKFERFSADDCRQQWEHLLQKVGKIRTLKELLDSAAAWLKKPIQTRGHTDLPKKPMSTYFAFQTKMAKKIKKQHPEAGVAEIARIVKKLYDELPESKKARQKERYQRDRAEYEERLKEFFEAHPDLKPVAKPRRPMKLFVDEQIRKKLEKSDDPAQQTDKALHEELRKKYSAKWQSLSDKKKARWILKSVSQYHDYLAVNPKAATSRWLNANEQKLLAVHQGRPLRPPSDIIRYFMSVCPHAMTAAPDGEAMEEDQQQQQHEPGIRSYAARWKALPLLEQIEHWRAYYQVVTAYETDIAEWQAKQDVATREISVAEENAFAKETASIFNDEEENGKKYGYTIKGPAGLVAFEERRQDHLKAKYPEEAADPSGLRKVALATFLKLSDDKRKTYEDKERERLEGVVTSVVKQRKRQPAATAKGGATAAKRLKSEKTLEIDGVQLPPEPKKPPRSAYSTFLVHRSELQAGDGRSCDVDGVSSEPPNHKNVMSSVSQSWKLLDAKEKEVWAERWKAEKVHYEARMKAYEKGLTPEQRAAYDKHRRTQANLHRLQLSEARKAKEAVRQQYAQRTVVYHPPGTGGGNKGGKLVQTTIDAVLKTGLARATAETGVGGVDAGNADTDDEEQRDSVTDVEDGGSSGSEEKSFATDVAPTRSPRKTAASTVAAPAASASPAAAGPANYSDDTEEDEDDGDDDDKPAARQSPRKTSSQQRTETVSDGRKEDRAKTKTATSGSVSAGRQPTASQSLQGTISAGSQKSVNGHTGTAIGKPRKVATTGKAS